MKVRAIALAASLSVVLAAAGGVPAVAAPPARSDITVTAAANGCGLGARAYTPATDSASAPWVHLLTYCTGMGSAGTLINTSDVVWAVQTPYGVTSLSPDGKKLQMHAFAVAVAGTDPIFPTRFVLPGETVSLSTVGFVGVRVDSDLTTRWHAFSTFVDALGSQRWADAWNCAAGATAIVRTDPATVWTAQQLYDVAFDAQATGETCLDAIKRRATDGSKTTRLPTGTAPKNRIVLNSPTRVREWVLTRPGAALADDALDIVWQIARAVR